MSQLEGGGTAPLDNEHLRSLDTGGIHGHGDTDIYFILDI